MIKTARVISLILLLSSFQLVAQVATPSPFVAEKETQSTVPGGSLIDEARADRALQLGFADTAAGAYWQILNNEQLSDETRHRIMLSLVTAMLDAGELEDANDTLKNYTGPKNSAYQLRLGLLAAFERRFGPAKNALNASKVDDLPPVDKGWWYHLQALVADSENDWPRRDNAYGQAAAAAVSEMQRARFLLAQDQALLRRAPLDENGLNRLKKNMEDFQGQRSGYDFARLYAAALTAVNRGGEAQAILQRQLATVPPSERNTADQLRLVLGLIAGERTTTGRNALKELLRNGQKPETQRLALHLLARGATNEGERTQMRRDLSELIGAPTQHTIIEDLLLTRAQLALTDKLYAAAEEDARALLDRYPGTALKPAALGIRLTVAWDSRRYRAAADLGTQLRDTLPPGRERAELGVLLAEAFFRAPDYKSAADAYDAALREAPAVVPAGVLIFQRVLSDIRAGTPEQLESAAKQLDEAANNPAFDPLRRWQAEWNLVKEMQVRGQSAAAATRVEKVLASGAQGVPEDLRIRLMWLRAKLSFDNGQPEIAMQQTDEMLALLDKSTALDATLRANIVSTTQLLKSQALLALKRDQEGFAVMDKLRKEFQGTAAAQNSYLIQADFLTQRGDLAGAQNVLQSFVGAEEYKKSPYVPFALYEIALILERQGLDRQLTEAYRKIEQLVRDFPTDEMVFYARLKQGDLLRKLNDFGAARQIYENLVNNESRHPDVLMAQIALADCLFALGANSAVNYENASAIYERLRDLPSAPVDLRAEAGFKWGFALSKRAQSFEGAVAKDQISKAQTVLWSVVDAFLIDVTKAKELGAKGRYWVSKSLLELGQIHESNGRIDEAQRAYQLILDYKLSGSAQAQAKLARFRPAAAAKP